MRSNFLKNEIYNMQIFQYNITIKPKRRGCHIITNEIGSRLPELKKIKSGIAFIFLKHTSASLTINENADPTVRTDLENYLNLLVPEKPDLYEHTLEGLDDMTSHIKNSLLGCSLTIPITNGQFNLGTWQGIYLVEHRNHAHSRNLVITILGEEYE